MSTGKAGVSEAGVSLRISELTASPVAAWEPRVITRVLAMARTTAVLAVLQEDDHDQQDGREDNQDDQDGECDVHI